MTPEELDEVITNIMQSTFHMTDEEAKPIVDGYIERYPELLNYYDEKFLYKI
jgi:hypothetical protein